jgi:putative transposase
MHAGVPGYRRLPALLKQEGHIVNHKRLCQLYREGRLGVRRRGGRKRALGTRAPMMVPQAPNQRSSVDFASVGASQKLDQFLAVGCASLPWSTTAPDNAWHWSPTHRLPGPASLGTSACCSPRESDNGTELTSEAILTWSEDHNINTCF